MLVLTGAVGAAGVPVKVGDSVGARPVLKLDEVIFFVVGVPELSTMTRRSDAPAVVSAVSSVIFLSAIANLQHYQIAVFGKNIIKVLEFNVVDKKVRQTCDARQGPRCIKV